MVPQHEEDLFQPRGGHEGLRAQPGGPDEKTHLHRPLHSCTYQYVVMETLIGWDDWSIVK